MGCYLIVAYLVRYILTDWYDRASHFWIAAIFDGVTFAGSSLVLWGMYEPGVLKLMGNTKPFLAIAAVVGLVYSIRALAPRS